MNTGYRIYGTAGGRLIPPWPAKLWPDAMTPEDADIMAPARCIGAVPHEAPAAGCTCGYRVTVNLPDLIRYGLHLRPPHWPIGMLPECGVLARVEARPPFRTGHLIPHDDPPTTYRVAGIELLDLHVGPVAAADVPSLQTTYACPVIAYEGDDWWTGIPA